MALRMEKRAFAAISRQYVVQPLSAVWDYFPLRHGLSCHSCDVAAWRDDVLSDVGAGKVAEKFFQAVERPRQPVGSFFGNIP